MGFVLVAVLALLGLAAAASQFFEIGNSPNAPGGAGITFPPNSGNLNAYMFFPVRIEQPGFTLQGFEGFITGWGISIPTAMNRTGVDQRVGLYANCNNGGFLWPCGNVIAQSNVGQMFSAPGAYSENMTWSVPTNDTNIYWLAVTIPVGVSAAVRERPQSSITSQTGPIGLLTSPGGNTTNLVNLGMTNITSFPDESIQPLASFRSREIMMWLIVERRSDDNVPGSVSPPPLPSVSAPVTPSSSRTPFPTVCNPGSPSGTPLSTPSPSSSGAASFSALLSLSLTVCALLSLL